MPEKDWEIYLPDGSRIIVLVNRRLSEIKSFTVVLVAQVEDEEVCITRYDTAHGQSHRDVLGRKVGLIEKEWLVSLTNREAFEYAIGDIRRNHEIYLQYYLQH